MENQKSMYPWMVFTLLCLNMFFSTVASIFISPLFSEIAKEISMNKAQMGTIMGASTLASILISPLAGGLSDKIGCRWVLGGVAILSAVAGGLRSVAGSVTELTMCMFFVGAGVVACIVLMPKVLATVFPREKLATMNAICFSFLTIGLAVAMGTAAGIISPAFNGWRGTSVAFSVICVVLGILWLLFYRDRETRADAQSEGKSMSGNFKMVLKHKEVWRTALYYGFVMIPMMGILALLPITLHEKGVARAGELVSFYLFIAFLGKILGGMASDKVGKRKAFLIAGAIVFGITLPGFILFAGIPLLIILAIGGIASGPIPPIMMTATVEIKEIGPAFAGTALGVILMVGTLGGSIGPPIAGALIDMFGSPLPGFIFFSTATIVGGLVFVPSKAK